MNGDPEQDFGYEEIGFARPILDGERLRDWWHEVLGRHGRYKGYLLFLALPSDVNLVQYLQEYGGEMHLISGEDYLVLFLTELGFRRYGIDDQLLQPALKDHVSKGHSLRIAEIFDIKLQEFPCLLVFRDVRSPEHFLVSFKDMDTAQITRQIRETFDVLRSAAANQEDPLAALEAHARSAQLAQAGKAVVGTLRQLPAKTLEVAMEAWIKSVLPK